MSSDGDNSQSSTEGIVMSEHPRETNSSSCRAINAETSDICGETEGLRILDQIRKIYEDRMGKVEQEEATGAEADFIPMKLKIMKEWIKDLGEQNIMLVRTVEDLEQAACHRVKVLEEKLRETAGIVSDKMSRLTKPSEETMNNLSTRLYQLEKDEKILQQKIEFLKSDIRGLLELIRRARCENCWSLDGIKFFEVQPDDIPMATECSCTEETTDTESVESLKHRLEVLSENEKKAHIYQAELQAKVADLDSKLISREETIKNYILMLESLRDNLKNRSTRKNQPNLHGSRQATNDFESDIASIMDIVESAIATRSSEEEKYEKQMIRDEKPKIHQCAQIEDLQAKLEAKSLEIERLSSRLNSLEKESSETREALTNEVAEKHDMGMALRAEVAALEEQCRRANMLMQFKEDIIKGMRREVKQRSSAKGTETGSSRRTVRINADAVCCGQPDDSSSQGPENCNGSNIASDFTNIKVSSKRDSEELFHVRTQLEEVVEKLHAKERENYERDMVNAYTKLKDIGTLLDNYKANVIDRNDTTREVIQSDKVKEMMDDIANVWKRWTENEAKLAHFERALEKRAKGERIAHHKLRDTHEANERWKWDVFDRQFNAMEEFRVCTVEAQAATENLREDMDIVVCNLQTRHQRYLGLSNVLKKMQHNLMRAKENISTAMCRLEKQEQERASYSEKIASGEVKLKDIKNEINKARSTSRDVVDFADKRKNLSSIEIHSCEGVIDEVVDTVEQVVGHLQFLRSQDQYDISVLSELKDQLCNMECSLDDFENEMDRTLSDNAIAEKYYDEKIPRLDKFERELDYAHTKMQDTLEGIVQSKQRMIDVGVCNLCSCTPSDTAMAATETTSRNEENHKLSYHEAEQLKNALRSKDKLLEDKDEIIRIQKDSIAMTHIQLNDLHEKMQAEIDSQSITISQHIEEKRLLHQGKLQNQTIGHLREAVVEAKRSLATQQQQQHPQQKLTFDLAVSEVWNPITPTIFNSADVHDV